MFLKATKEWSLRPHHFSGEGLVLHNTTVCIDLTTLVAPNLLPKGSGAARLGVLMQQKGW